MYIFINALLSLHQDQVSYRRFSLLFVIYVLPHELKPTKSVVLNITHKQCKQEHNNLTFTMGPNKIHHWRVLHT
jgi:hypothetical protein